MGLVNWVRELMGTSTQTQLDLRDEAHVMEVKGGKMLVKNFKAAFKEEFGVDIKVHQGLSFGHFADDDATIASICSDKVTNPSWNVALHGNLTVRNAEEAIKDAMGFRVQILAKDGTNADNDARLSSLR